MRSNVAVLYGFCPNSQCGKKLYFPENEATVECVGCGKRHTPSTLTDVKRLTSDKDIVIGIIDALDRLLNADAKIEVGKKDGFNHDRLKVDGMTNCLAAILSPLFTTHGMDKASGKAKLLTEMGKNPVFDCGQLCDRAFFIDPNCLDIPGYGYDRSGSRIYLRDTLEQIKLSNDKEDRLVPVHADGDGHCLVHAVSRALIGWELFWHPLRVNLKQHFLNNLDKYRAQFGDFIDESEWSLIIAECDPNFIPSGLEPTGLRNIHIFGLANVLRRPIVLLDCLEGIQSSGDYSAIFLPIFSPPSACKSKEGVLNKPLCIAWSSQGRNHFIPLVGVKGRKCPVLPRYMIQRCWGVSDIMIDKYVQFDDRGSCQIGGEKVLQSTYIQKLVGAMSAVFYKHREVSPNLLADMQEQIFKANGLACGLSADLLLEKAQTSLSQQLLFLCLTCRSLALAQPVSPAWCVTGGELYDLAVSCHGPILKDGQTYTFPLHSIAAVYDAKLDKLVPSQCDLKPGACLHCSGLEFRQVTAEYIVKYKDGDRTQTRSNRCLCGYKHFYEGKEYDTVPKKILVLMEWGGQAVKKIVNWFHGEEDESLNSNAYSLAQDLVQAQFPGEFGSERLVQKVVDQILAQTKSTEENKEVNRILASRQSGDETESMEVCGGQEQPGAATSSQSQPDPGEWSPHHATKAIITGLQRQSVHREELNKSAAEKRVRSQIETHAPRQQQKLTNRLAAGDTVMKSQDKLKLQSPVSSPTEPTSSPDPPNSRDVASTTSAISKKQIRLSLSDNRNMTLDLPSECKFLELQTLISGATLIPASQLRIRHGFPPKELKAPASSELDYLVPVQPGDRIMVDVVGGAGNNSPAGGAVGRDVIADRKRVSPARKVDPPWRSLAEGGMDEVSDRVLQGLMNPLLNSGGDSLDHSLSALALTAALENRDLWSHAQRLPHLFSVDGAFYRQVERDIGLEHGRHYQVPLLPHKLFVYNRHADRLELCLEPYGHFPVEPNVERNSESMLPTARCSKNKLPFSGQGHVLKSSQEDRMPTDIPMSPKRPEARRLNTLCDPAVHQESIEEVEEEETEAVSQESTLNSHRLNPAELVRRLPLSHSSGLGGPKRSGVGGGLPHHLSNHLHGDVSNKLVRRGPGYSELSPIPETSDPPVTSPDVHRFVDNNPLTSSRVNIPAAGSSVASASVSSTGLGGSGAGMEDPRLNMLHQLVSKIEQAVEMMGSEAQAISEGQQPSFRTGRGNIVNDACLSSSGGLPGINDMQQNLNAASMYKDDMVISEHSCGNSDNNDIEKECETVDQMAPSTVDSVNDPDILSPCSSSNPLSFNDVKPHNLSENDTFAHSLASGDTHTFTKPSSISQGSSTLPAAGKRRQLPPTPSFTPPVFVPKASVSPSSSSSSSTRSSPERKPGGNGGRSSGMRNSCSNKEVSLSSMTHSLESQALVAALAGQVASGIAAMDTELVRDDEVDTNDGYSQEVDMPEDQKLSGCSDKTDVEIRETVTKDDVSAEMKMEQKSCDSLLVQNCVTQDSGCDAEADILMECAESGDADERALFIEEEEKDDMQKFDEKEAMESP